MSLPPLGLNRGGLCCAAKAQVWGRPGRGFVPSSPSYRLCGLGEATLALSFLICPLETAADPTSKGFLRTQ